jgi:hypothetical protein
MRIRLRLERRKQKVTLAGKELSTSDKKKLNTIRSKKKRLLENIIFPSMANLIFFFESINEDKILEKTFSDEVEDLLGIRRNDPNLANYGIFFWRLVSSIISIHSPGHRKDYSDDHRLRLMAYLQEIVGKKISLIIRDFLATDDAIRIVNQDIGRAAAWSELAASVVKDYYDFGILSETIPGGIGEKESEKRIKKREEEFQKNARINAPDRTFNFNTKELLNDIT